MVVMDGKEGQLGIVKGHSPLLAILKPGPVRMITDEKEEVFFTEGGFAEVNQMASQFLWTQHKEQMILMKQRFLRQKKRLKNF